MTLHPQAAAAIKAWASEPSVVGADPVEIERRRVAAQVEAAQERREPVAQTTDLDADGVACRLFRPTGESGGAIVFAHGGGFVFGDLETHDAQARRLANRTGLAVLAVDYRRPPEHVFPAAHDDVSAAARWLAGSAEELGLDATRLVALGDSAGGSLALVAALRDPGLFAATVLVYPFIDPQQRGASMGTQGEHGFDSAEAEWYWQSYAGGPERVAVVRDDPDFCPLDAAGLGDLPPTQVLIAEHDILRDEDLLLVRRIELSGGRVSPTAYSGMIHGFWRHPDVFDAAELALADTVVFLNGVLAR